MPDVGSVETLQTLSSGVQVRRGRMPVLRPRPNKGRFGERSSPRRSPSPKSARTPRARTAQQLCASVVLATPPEVIRRIWRAHGPQDHDPQSEEAYLAQLDDIKGKLRAAAYTSRGVDLRRLFAFLDKNNGGHVDFEGFTRAIRRQRVPKERLPDETLWWLFQTIDEDNSGTIDVDEFITFMGDPEPCSSNRGVNLEGSLMKRVNALVPSVEEMAALKRKIRASSYTIGGVSLQKYFQFVDRDGNG